MPKINTLNSLNDEELPNGYRPDFGENSDDSDAGRQGFFVGGSEHSGQQVLGPNDADRERSAHNLFEAVRRAGAEELTEEEAAKIRSSNADSSYQGSAYRLGTSDEPVQHEPTSEPSDPHKPVFVRIIVWQNGFSIDDGPLRSFDDPANQPFLDSIKRGIVPAELQAQHRGRLVDLHMERRATPYVPPKTKPFSSQGVRLGSIVPEVVTLDNDTDSSAVPKLSEEECKTLLEKAQREVNLDTNKQKGQIQIRQPNGQRFVGEFNESHTVEDVRSFIVTALPDYAYQPFSLHTTYPKKAIEDEKQTVTQAGIFKAVVIMVKD